MSDVKESSCRLCIKSIIDTNFEVVDNVIRDILDVLLPKLKFDNENKEVICSVCRRKLYAALEFKSACLKTDYTIIPYLDCEKMLQLDIRDVYTKEKTSESMDISDSQKICRLCMEPVDSEFRCIREEELEAIEKLAPELIINIVKDPVICKECFGSVCTHNNFLKDCLEVEEKIKSIFDSSVSRSQIDTSPLDLLVKTENLDKEFDSNKIEMSIKAENIDIKSEDEERSDTPLQCSDKMPFEESVCKNEEEVGYKQQNGSEMKTKQERKVLYKCDKCIYETGSEIPFTAHFVRHENDSEVYKCESCEYKTENEKSLQRHLSRHKDPLQIQMYKCKDCDFETKYKSNVKNHQLKHKDPSQVQMYRCNDCGYKTINKSHIKRHQLKHKDPSQVQTYRCNDCDYETINKSHIKRHQLKHKDPSQVQLYRCNDCDYETKYKDDMKKHQLKHKDPSQVQIYRCTDCSYETKYSRNIKRHQLKHKDASQVQMYRCNDCSYETKCSKDMKGHQLKHKDPSQVQTYRCNDCDFETKYKNNIKKHQLKHKGPSQLQMFKCNDCDFETKYKSVINKHQLQHRDPSQVQLYGCNDCDYETKYKGDMKKHQLKHNDPSQVQMLEVTIDEFVFFLYSKGDCRRAMSDVKETSCRLCIKSIIDTSFEVVDNVIRDILDVLLPKLKFDNENKEVICSVCRRKLYAALEFKSACLKTDYTIISYLDCEKMLQLDIRDVYTKEKTSESMDISDSQKICRLCMEPVESEFRCIREEELEAIKKLAPELIINIIKDPVICKECFDSVCTHNNFLKDCLEAEEKIKSTFDHSASRSQIDTSPLDLFVKTGNLDKEFDINEIEMSIKAKNIDIKSEDEERSVTPLQCCDKVPFEESVCKNEEEEGYKQQNGSEMKIKQESKVLYKCDKCIYETGSEIRFMAHFVTHENDSEVYKRESSEYETENEKSLQRHLARHKDPSKVQMYKCNDCDYETKYKACIKRHKLKHKDPSQVQMYRCKDCDYETKYKDCIKKHQLKHKDPSQVQMYKCNACNYETKYFKYMKGHQLKHKDPSQVQTYRCNECDFETKY
ncbi:zinc finger protein 729-like, partial [Anoplophora glabripennis]|uniref:zinc finger protein 729-like n=1 Tax=Anoplophora glabripennis TaxID=217634 RepID=UPI000C782B9D